MNIPVPHDLPNQRRNLLKKLLLNNIRNFEKNVDFFWGGGGVPEEKRPLEILSLGKSIILKLFLKTYDGRWSTELIWLRLNKKRLVFM
jgi:hypothetical protein